MNNDRTASADVEQDPGSENVGLARKQLELARRILELTREQEKAVAVLPDEEAIGRFLALVDARQECMDRVDLLQQARAQSVEAVPTLDGPEAGEIQELAAAIEEAFGEVARIDAENRLVLERQRDRLRDEIRQVKQGREALRSYGFQESGGADSGEGAFVDRKK